MRHRIALVGVAFAVVLLVAWALTRSGPGTSAASPPSPRPTAAPPQPPPAGPRAVEVRRDVFRFADGNDGAEAGPASGTAPRRESKPAAEPTPEPGPRLVGLVYRGGHVVAALVAQDGEVELAGPGETAAGVVVVAIDADSVRLRRPDGVETTLRVP